MPPWNALWISTASIVAALLVGAAVLHLIPRVGGKSLSAALCAGLPLDLLIGYFTVAPQLYGAIRFGWIGLAAAVVAQLVALILWEIAHETWHRNTKGRSAILRASNDISGTFNNLFAVFWTLWAVPLFALTRLAQWCVYPPLTWTVRLPKYRSSEWVNVTRHKVSGLVGHDRIWCLYCDWMTGVWSLGTEMLRNVESFWCPIRFGSNAKCDNCKIDFPDVATGWVGFDTSADIAAAAVREHYPKDQVERAWWGKDHVELTVRGKTL